MQMLSCSKNRVSWVKGRTVIFRVLLDYLLDLQFHVGGAVDRFAGVLGKLLHGDHLLRFLLFAQPYDCDAAPSPD
jgi:hypothetical protein